MYSNEDLERFYFQYQTEAVPLVKIPNSRHEEYSIEGRAKKILGFMSRIVK